MVYFIFLAYKTELEIVHYGLFYMFDPDHGQTTKITLGYILKT